MNKTITPKNSINGIVNVEGDKSISHRAIIIGSLANGITKINNFLLSKDCLATIKCFKDLGVDIKIYKNQVIINGKGLYSLKQPTSQLDVKNSGTTIRLISGILSGQNFESIITGDESIKKRPMDRIIEPLKILGANISGKDNKFAPLYIKKGNLNFINYKLPVASAQVKSCILLASLYGKQDSIINEPIKCRDHTERMLEFFGAKIKKLNDDIIISPNPKLIGKNVYIPGDISSASFFIVAALILENSNITIKNIGINDTRTGIITVLKKMGANIQLNNKKIINNEPISDITVKTSKLNGIIIEKDLIPLLIDEIPIIAVCALFASGKTIIKDASELKVKETNRIKVIVSQFKKMGANIEETDDGMIIYGDNIIKGTKVNSYKDHRIAMSLSILALKASGKTEIENSDCVDISFPNFYNILDQISS